MKYLYRILRLFFCPHKYEVLSTQPINRVYENVKTGKPLTVETELYTLQCKYCGKISSKEIP